MKNLPNIITSIRIVGVFFLLGCESSSLGFYIIYTLCGLSDAIDGWIARKTKTTSEFGAKLDSVADLLFYFAMLIKVLPVLANSLPLYIWYMTGGIIAIRIMSYAVAFIKYHKFASLHTYMNKITGLVVFMIPYVMSNEGFVRFSMLACTVALIAAVEEVIIHIFSREYHSNEKSLLDFMEGYTYAK